MGLHCQFTASFIYGYGAKRLAKALKSYFPILSYPSKAWCKSAIKSHKIFNPNWQAQEVICQTIKIAHLLLGISVSLRRWMRNRAFYPTKLSAKEDLETVQMWECVFHRLLGNPCPRPVWGLHNCGRILQESITSWALAVERSIRRDKVLRPRINWYQMEIELPCRIEIVEKLFV